jgi:hypothetical protein
MMSTDQERLVALLSEVNMLKDRKLKISKDTQGSKKGKKPEDKGKLQKGTQTKQEEIRRGQEGLEKGPSPNWGTQDKMHAWF